MGGIQEILNSRQFPGISTRDTFGIKNEFYDHRTKQYIDTRKKWERAGFKNPMEMDSKHHPSDHKAMLKEKIKEKKRKYGGIQPKRGTI